MDALTYYPDIEQLSHTEFDDSLSLARLALRSYQIGSPLLVATFFHGSLSSTGQVASASQAN